MISGTIMSLIDSPSTRHWDEQPRWSSGPALVLYCALAEFLLQVLTASRYGIFRDELYYYACSQHLAWGYVDQPPLIAALVWLERHVGGSSLYSLRFLSALAGAVTVWLTGHMTGKLGGGRTAQAMAALSTLIASGLLAFWHIMTMNAFEPLIWLACGYVVMRVIQTGDQRLWVWFGILAGVGLENKWSMGVFGVGVALGLLFTRERRAFAQKWIWIALALAMVIWLPNVLWNVRHHWPFFELLANIRRHGRDVALAPLAFILQQVLFMNPLTAPVWIGGAIWFFAGRDRESGERGRYAALGWVFLTVLAIFIVAKGKAYYVWPVFPMAFAAGGVAFEAWTRRISWFRPAYALLMLAAGAFLLPMMVPVLSPEKFIAYETRFHLVPPAVEHQPVGPLQHQLYADMFGWKDMAEATARAYHALPPEQQKITGITAQNYGDAGAIDYFGPKLGIPNAISGHQSFWYWGPGDYTGESLIMVGEDADRIAQLCSESRLMAQVNNPYSRGDEHKQIWWCHLRWNLQQLWPKAKHFD